LGEYARNRPYFLDTISLQKIHVFNFRIKSRSA
jgi:hypothetical protein